MVIKVEFPKELEHTFREFAMRKYGFSKGSIKKASEEAINDWVETQANDMPKVHDPIALLDGMLKHLKGKMTSVELQHEARRLWTK